MATKQDVQEAIFNAIGKVVAELEEAGYDPTTRAIALERVALAYRYAAGGTQPGASVVPS